MKGLLQCLPQVTDYISLNSSYNQNNELIKQLIPRPKFQDSRIYLDQISFQLKQNLDIVDTLINYIYFNALTADVGPFKLNIKPIKQIGHEVACWGTVSEWILKDLIKRGCHVVYTYREYLTGQ